MNVFCIILSFVNTGVTDGWLHHDSFVYADAGLNVTLRGQVTQASHTPMFIFWYRQTTAGTVRPLCYFTKFSTEQNRYSGQLPTILGSTFLTIRRLMVKDSGRYFSVLTDRKKIYPGPTHYLLVSDSVILPSLRVFGESQRNSTIFLCELSGGGQGWDDPFWETEGNATASQQQTGLRIDEDGSFIRWSVITLPKADNTLTVKCVCHHNEKGVLIQSAKTHMSTVERSYVSVSSCKRLMVLGSVCGLLIFVTGGFTVFWARRFYKSRQNWTTPVTNR